MSSAEYTVTGKLTPKQLEAHKLLASDSVVKILGYGGAKGGGKSWYIRRYLVERCSRYPGTTGLLVRKTYQELYRNHVRQMLTEYPFLHHNADKNEFRLPNGSNILLSYAECARDYDRFQGVEVQHVAIDQAEQYPRALFDEIRSCMRAQLKLQCKPKMIVTFNWGNVGHKWLRKMFWDKIADHNDDMHEIAFLRALAYDNPHIDPEYFETLKKLPEQLRRAYLEGDPDAFEGQFFNVLLQSAEKPFYVSESDAIDNLYGSLDHGITHDTAFGLWYLDKLGFKHHLFLYLNNGATARDHAVEVRQKIQSFPWTHGHLPQVVWADPSMWTKTRLNEQMVRSVIDEYIDVFAGTPVIFEPANNDKQNGCAIMHQEFKISDGLPNFRYWPEYSHGLVESLHAMVGDENRKEQYAKMDGDDAVDMCRYGLVGLSTVMAQRRSNQHNAIKFKTYKRSHEKMDWMSLAS
jgi:hypothetical protein